jgi:CHAD domain-containing protein
MLKSFILNYFQTNTDLFFKAMALASKSAGVEAVHDMRVSLKRIDTLIRMLNFEKKANFRMKKSFSPFRRLFKLAGPLRDFQVQVIILDEMSQAMTIDAEIVESFHQKSGFLTMKFLLAVKSINVLQTKRNLKLVCSYIEKCNDDELKKQISLYELDRKALLKHYSIESRTGSSLHSARKIIKDLSYLIEMQNPGKANVISKLASFKEAGHILGDWHDRHVMLNYLQELGYKTNGKSSGNTQKLQIDLFEQKEKLQQLYFEKYQALEKV